MKKVLLVAMALCLASFAGAASLSFSQGAAFIQPADTDYMLSVGSSTQIMWYADDLGYGVKNENTALVYDSGADLQAINEIMIQKFLSKSVAIGLGVGTANIDDYNGSLIELNGAIQILSGKGEKIAASLDFGIAARWIRIPAWSDDVNQTATTLAVTIGL